jgi:hypothetical protein
MYVSPTILLTMDDDNSCYAVHMTSKGKGRERRGKERCMLTHLSPAKIVQTPTPLNHYERDTKIRLIISYDPFAMPTYQKCPC